MGQGERDQHETGRGRADVAEPRGLEGEQDRRPLGGPLAHGRRRHAHQGAGTAEGSQALMHGRPAVGQRPREAAPVVRQAPRWGEPGGGAGEDQAARRRRDRDQAHAVGRREGDDQRDGDARPRERRDEVLGGDRAGHLPEPRPRHHAVRPSVGRAPPWRPPRPRPGRPVLTRAPTQQRAHQVEAPQAPLHPVDAREEAPPGDGLGDRREGVGAARREQVRPPQAARRSATADRSTRHAARTTSAATTSTGAATPTIRRAGRSVDGGASPGASRAGRETAITAAPEPGAAGHPGVASRAPRRG
jgi:hypothetical protein